MLLGVALLAGGAMAKPGIFDSYKALITELKCAEMPDNGTCAILFDEDDCDGWQLAVNEGYTELPDKTSFSLKEKRCGGCAGEGRLRLRRLRPQQREGIWKIYRC